MAAAGATDKAATPRAKRTRGATNPSCPSASPKSVSPPCAMKAAIRSKFVAAKKVDVSAAPRSPKADWLNRRSDTSSSPDLTAAPATSPSRIPVPVHAAQRPIIRTALGMKPAVCATVGIARMPPPTMFPATNDAAPSTLDPSSSPASTNACLPTNRRSGDPSVRGRVCDPPYVRGRVNALHGAKAQRMSKYLAAIL